MSTPPAAVPAGETCPHCGESGFKRLTQHIAMKHSGIKDPFARSATTSPSSIIPEKHPDDCSCDQCFEKLWDEVV